MRRAAGFVRDGCCRWQDAGCAQGMLEWAAQQVKKAGGAGAASSSSSSKRLGFEDFQALIGSLTRSNQAVGASPS